MSPVGMVGWGAVAVLVVGWLVVSFSKPGRARDVLEWVSATSLFVALASLFTSLCLRAHAADSILGLVAFGFLLFVFSCGTLVSLWHTLQSLRGPKATQASTTN